METWSLRCVVGALNLLTQISLTCTNTEHRVRTGRTEYTVRTECAEHTVRTGCTEYTVRTERTVHTVYQVCPIGTESSMHKIQYNRVQYIQYIRFSEHAYSTCGAV